MAGHRARRTALTGAVGILGLLLLVLAGPAQAGPAHRSAVRTQHHLPHRHGAHLEAAALQATAETTATSKHLHAVAADAPAAATRYVATAAPDEPAPVTVRQLDTPRTRGPPVA